MPDPTSAHRGPPQFIVRHGRTYRAAIEPVHVAALEAAIAVDSAQVEVDAELRHSGREHLERVLARSPGAFDGAALALDRIDADGVVHALHGRYFDLLATCDALVDPELRAQAELLAGPDPLRNGRGRMAGIGISAVVVRNGVFTLGRRSESLAMDPGRWHIVPSGTIDGRGLVATLVDELAEEHGLPRSALDGARVIALGHDVDRLHPELIAMTRDLGAAPAPRAGNEFSAFRDVALDPAAIDELWRHLGPDELTPAAAVALAAVERELSD